MKSSNFSRNILSIIAIVSSSLITSSASAVCHEYEQCYDYCYMSHGQTICETSCDIIEYCTPEHGEISDDPDDYGTGQCGIDDTDISCILD